MNVEKVLRIFESQIPPTDPQIDAVYDQARIFEAQMNTPDGPILPEQAIAYITELDRMWPIRGTKITVTGQVYHPELPPYLEDDGTLPEESIYDNTVKGNHLPPDRRIVSGESYRSDGFRAYLDTVEDRKTGYQRWRVAHYLIYEQPVSQRNGETGVVPAMCAALLDDVYVESEYESAEYVMRAAEYYFPEVTAEVNKIIKESASRETAIVALGKLVITRERRLEAAHYKHLGQYVATKLKFDYQAPSVVAVQKDSVVFMPTDGRYGIALADSRHLVTDMGILVMFNNENTQSSEHIEILKDQLIFGLSCNELLPIAQGGSVAKVFPLKYIYKVTNSREQFYGKKEKDT